MKEEFEKLGFKVTINSEDYTLGTLLLNNQELLVEYAGNGFTISYTPFDAKDCIKFEKLIGNENIDSLEKLKEIVERIKSNYIV